MQPFPTAFWKSSLEPLEQDSCFSIENTFLIGEDTDGNSEYFLGEVINTDANPYLLSHEYSTTDPFKPGLYIDAVASDADEQAGVAFTFSSIGSDEDFYNPKLYTKNFEDLLSLKKLRSITSEQSFPLSDTGGTVLGRRPATGSMFHIVDMKERFGREFFFLPDRRELEVDSDIQALLSDWPIFMLNRFKKQIASNFQVRKKNATTKIYTVGHWKAASILPIGVEEQGTGLDGAICEPVLTLTDKSAAEVNCSRKGNFKHGHRAMQKHFSYVWMRKSGLHKTHPVTVTLSEDCKTVRTKCYFEKDLSQKFSEISIKKDEASLELLSSRAKKYIRDTLILDPFYDQDNEIVRELVEFGYNGHYWGEDGPDDGIFSSAELNYLYRQSAKVDIGINFSEAKNIVVKVRGLGSDDHGSLYEGELAKDDEKNLQKFQKKFVIDEIDALSNIIDDMPEDIMGRSDPEIRSTYSYGDRQTCMIVINSEPEIFATSPNAGVYQRDFNYTIDGSVEFSNFAKGPVRVFQKIANFTAGQRKSHSEFIHHEIEAGSDLLGYRFTGGGGDLDLPGISRVGGGTNDRRNIIDTLNNGQYRSGKRGSGNFHPGYGLEYLTDDGTPTGTPYAPDSFANYYGTLYKPSHAHFYDYDSITSSNLDTPNYSSPYTYQQTFELPAGESKIEIIFDSVFNFLNGGAYYDIEISYT